MSRRRGTVQRHGPTWRWGLDINAEGEKRKRVFRSGFRTKADAQRDLHDYLRKLDGGTAVERHVDTFGGLRNSWLAGRAVTGLQATTIDSYRRSIDRHVIPVLGHRRIQTLRTQDLNALYRGMIDGIDGRAAVSTRTTRYAHTIVRSALEDARRQGLIGHNPTDDATAPSASAARPPEMPTWTPDELARFLDAVEGSEHWPLLWVAAFTGMRRGELCGLRWDDVDLDGAVLTVRHTRTAVGHQPVEGDTKSQKGRRRLDLDADTVAVLRRRKIGQREDQLLMGAGWQNDTDLVFTMPDGRPWHPDVTTKAFRRLVDTADVPRIRLHDLRHTHATHLLATGANVKIVSERLGHASVAFTLDTYGHVMPGQQADAAATVAKLVNDR